MEMEPPAINQLRSANSSSLIHKYEAFLLIHVLKHENNRIKLQVTK